MTMRSKSRIIEALQRHQRKYYPDLAPRYAEPEADPNPRGPHSPQVGNPTSKDKEKDAESKDWVDATKPHVITIELPLEGFPFGSKGTKT